MSRRIYHLATRREIEQAGRNGSYAPPTLLSEGFIHCSYAAQLEGVARRYFQGRSDLALLEIDPLLVRTTIVDENLTGGQERYPHIYGALPMSAVTAISELTPRADGGFEWPCQVRECLAP